MSAAGGGVLVARIGAVAAGTAFRRHDGGRFASGDAARRAVVERCRAAARVVDVSELVTLSKLVTPIRDRMAQLAERRAAQIGAVYAGLGHAELHAAREGAAAAVSLLVALLASRAVDLMAQLPYDFARDATIRRRRCWRVFVTAADEQGEARDQSDQCRAPNTGIHAHFRETSGHPRGGWQTWPALDVAHDLFHQQLVVGFAVAGHLAHAEAVTRLAPSFVGGGDRGVSFELLP